MFWVAAELHVSFRVHVDPVGFDDVGRPRTMNAIELNGMAGILRKRKLQSREGEARQENRIEI